MEKWTVKQLKGIAKYLDIPVGDRRKAEIYKLLKKNLTEHKNISKGYSPRKYYASLPKKDIKKRLEEIYSRIMKNEDDRKSYLPFETDYDDEGNLRKTNKSLYTRAWKKIEENSKKRYIKKKGDPAWYVSLKNKEKISGIPYDILKKVFERGEAAWRTGHRPGAGQQQWGHARVNSFLTKGCTHYSADYDLVKIARRRKQAREFWDGMECKCTRGCERKS